MKILLISNLYPSKKHPYFGTFVKVFEEGLKKENVDFKHIIITKETNTLRKAFTYFKFFLSVIYNLNFKSRKFDIIYVHFLNHSLLPFFFVKKKNLPLVLNSHGSDIFPQNIFASRMSAYTSKLLKYAEIIVVPSQYFSEIISKKFNIEKEKIFISPSGGVDLTKFKYEPRLRRKFTIGFLSRIESGKKWKLFLESIHILKEKIPQLEVLVAGGGPDVEIMKNFIKDNDIQDIVNYLGFLSHEDVPGFFNDVDVLIFPSERKAESLGLVAVEALASGVPVVCFKNGATQEFIKNGFNGYVYDKNSPVQLVQTITKLYKLSAQQRKEMSENARNSAYKFSNILTAKKMKTKLMELTDKVVDY